MASAIATQNNIMDIITTQAKITNEIISAVCTNITKDKTVLFLKKETLKKYNDNLMYFINESNILKSIDAIIGLYNKIPNINAITIKTKRLAIKSLFNGLSKMMHYAGTLNDNLLSSDLNNVNMANISIIIDQLKSIVDGFSVFRLKDILIARWKIGIIKRLYRKALRLVDFIKNHSSNIIKVSKVTIGLTILGTMMTELRKVIDIFTFFKIKDLVSVKIKYFFLTYIIKSIRRLVHQVGKISSKIGMMIRGLLGLTLLRSLMLMIRDIMDITRDITLKTLLIFNFKLRKIKKAVRGLIKLINEISLLGSIADTGARTAKVLLSLTIDMYLIRGIFDIVKSTKTWRIVRKCKRIIRGLHYINIILRRLNRMRLRRKSIIKLHLISLLFFEMSLLFLQVVLISPIALLFSLAMIAIVAAVLVLLLSVKAITMLIQWLIKTKVMIKFMLLLLIIGAIVVMTIMMYVIAVLAKKVVKDFLNILILMGIIIAVVAMMVVMGVIMAALTPLMTMMLIGIGMITLVIGLLLGICVMLWLLTKLDIDFDKLQDNIHLIFESVDMIITSVFRDDKEENKKSDKGFLSRLFEMIGGAVMKIISVIMMIPYMILVFGAIGLITLIAGELAVFSKIIIDKGKIKDNIDIIFSTIEMIIKMVFRRDEVENRDSNKGFMRTLLSKVGGIISAIVDVIMMIPYLIVSIGAIGLLTILAGQLSIISNIHIDKDIDEKVGLIINSANVVINKILEGPSKEITSKRHEGWFKSTFRELCPGLAGLSDAIAASAVLSGAVIAVGMTAEIAKQLGEINNFNFESDTIKDKVGLIIDCSKTVLKRISEDANFDKSKIRRFRKFARIIKRLNKALTGFSEIDDKAVKNTGAVVDHYIRFVQKIDGIKLDNLKASTRMFRQMARFSESIGGNFDRLADAINEKLMPAMEELKELLEKMPDRISGGLEIGQTQDTIMSQDVDNQVTGSAWQSVAQPIEDNTKKNKEINNNTNDLLISDKIDELIDILTNGNGRIQVMTI